MDCAGNGWNDCSDRIDRSQGNECDPMSKASLVLLASPQSQARLTDATWTYQANTSALWVSNEPVQVNQLLLSSEKGRL